MNDKKEKGEIERRAPAEPAEAEERGDDAVKQNRLGGEQTGQGTQRQAAP